MELMAERPYWRVSFTEKGVMASPDPGTLVDEVVASGVADLFVISHGWATSVQSATQLYQSLLPMIVAAAADEPRLGPVGLVGIFWPSLWFPDGPAAAPAPGGHALSDPVESEGAGTDSGDSQLTGIQIAAALRGGFDSDSAKVLDQLGELIDEGVAAAVSGESSAVQVQRLAAFHELLGQMVASQASLGFEDSGERALLLSDDPARGYAHAAALFSGSDPQGDAQGLGDGFARVWRGAKDVLRVFSYYTMKARAGQIGQFGLGPWLADLHAADPRLRVHLVGHSFGARLVSFALAGIPDPQASPVASLTLVQAAFSHWAFAGSGANPFGSAGALSNFADRVHGPLLATHSDLDWAVGRWYPRASALAGHDASAVAVGRWGALGASGFQGVPQARSGELGPVGTSYDLEPGGFLSINASGIISNWRDSAFAGAHSDIRKPELAHLIASAAACGR